MTKTLRSRLVLAVSALAVVAAGAVVTAQAVVAQPAAPAAGTPAVVAETVDTNGWTETRVRGTIIRP